MAREEFKHAVKQDVEARVREGVKVALEEVLEEEMTEYLGAGYRELAPTRRGERNGHYARNQEGFMKVLAVEVAGAEKSAATLATEILSRASEEWTLKPRLAVDTLEAAVEPNPQHPRR